MDDFILKLRNGQILRILPFDNGDLYKPFHHYFFDDVGGFVLDPETNITFTTRLQRAIRNYYLVDDGQSLHIIRTGQRLKFKIDEYFSDDSGHTFYSPEHLIDCYIALKPMIEKISGFDSYDNSMIYQQVGNENEYQLNDLFNSPAYVKIMSEFYEYMSRMKLENQPEKIKLINDHQLFKDNYKHLLRNIKINQFRENKIDTTKTKLWNQVISMVGDTSHENEQIEDVGYLKDNGEGDEVHQFMVDGYLFEVKLKDNVK